ncbi:hypothetical protein PVL30_005656 [Lodderomyces elongisporus]|uniref:uncharacterized protein n=1 Tax=Lodderomyces elongisporus TaxID=36914 RepID=UPI00291CE68B|nr:uncharacterized protein PVL30_005656 [Lodderomyces elongisporus]WLF81855.1 hypothetical protein PVL30_005656 [Lodderomyces elongisporus]
MGDGAAIVKLYRIVDFMHKVWFKIPEKATGSPLWELSSALDLKRSETFYEIDLGAEDVEKKKSVRRQFPSLRPFGWFKERREEKELAERVLLAKGMVAGVQLQWASRIPNTYSPFLKDSQNLRMEIQSWVMGSLLYTGSQSENLKM